jgi:hypothetical protein
VAQAEELVRMKDEKLIDNVKFGFRPMVTTYHSFDEMLESIGANSSAPAGDSRKTNIKVKKVG